MKTAITLFLCGLFLTAWAGAQEDPYLWLEDVTGAKALEWVKQRNDVTKGELEAVPGFRETNERILAVLQSKERVPGVARYREKLYNFWRDAEHTRGLWRRTTLAEYRKASPAWETVLDLDALAKQENENWVWEGADLLYPDYARCLITLSRGGSDAAVTREFDLVSKTFVKDGFQLPEAKSQIAWIDRDTVFVGTDFGPGSLTDSGYPRIVKIWKRGTPLAQARTVFEGKATSVSAGGARHFSRFGHMDIIQEGTSFFSAKNYFLVKGKLVPVAIPDDALIAGYFEHQVIVQLRTPWETNSQKFPAGALIICKRADLEAGKGAFELLMAPGARESIEVAAPVRGGILVSTLDNVVGRLWRFTRNPKAGWWKKEIVIGGKGSLGAFNMDEEMDDFFVSFQDFLTPSTVLLVNGTTGKKEKLKSMPAFFDASPYEVRQYEAESKDGVRVPYFMVCRKGLPADGQQPTLVYAYGGFEVPMAPYYSAATGIGWLEKGGVFVLANIRGGGEFGPQWHNSAILKNRHKVYEDLFAVTEDLFRRNITNHEKVGIMGGSNGGLMVGACFTLRPELFRAVVCQVPLLDMQRYHKLLAGASWKAEYGDPDDPDMWAYLKNYSPYQIVRADKKYPRVLFDTSTRDDRVHPAHARKMAARMLEQGHSILYYENVEGGHGMAANQKQSAYMSALEYAFLWHELMGK